MDMPNHCTNVDCPNFIHLLAVLGYLRLHKEFQAKSDEYVKKLEKLVSMMDLQFEELEHNVKKL